MKMLKYDKSESFKLFQKEEKHEVRDEALCVWFPVIALSQFSTQLIDPMSIFLSSSLALSTVQSRPQKLLSSHSAEANYDR